MLGAMRLTVMHQDCCTYTASSIFRRKCSMMTAFDVLAPGTPSKENVPPSAQLPRLEVKPATTTTTTTTTSPAPTQCADDTHHDHSATTGASHVHVAYPGGLPSRHTAPRLFGSSVRYPGAGSATLAAHDGACDPSDVGTGDTLTSARAAEAHVRQSADRESAHAHAVANNGMTAR